MTNDAGSTESTLREVVAYTHYEDVRLAIWPSWKEQPKVVHRSYDFADKLLALLSQHGARIVRSTDSKVDVCEKCSRVVCDGVADYVCVRPLVEKP